MDRQQIIQHFFGAGTDLLRQVVAAQNHPPAFVDDLPLLVQHIVVVEQLFANFEVMRLHFLLRVLDRAGDHAGLDRHAFLHAELQHDLRDAVRSEYAKEIVLQREIKAGGAWIALPT